MASRVSVYGIPTVSGMVSAVRLHFSFLAFCYIINLLFFKLITEMGYDYEKHFTPI